MGNLLPAPVSPQQMFGLGIQSAEQTSVVRWCVLLVIVYCNLRNSKVVCTSTPFGCSLAAFEPTQRKSSGALARCFG
jgi:hypothetical protein